MKPLSNIMVQKLLKLSIMDVLDHVWSETGITPSKKTRRTILKAAEKITDDVAHDFRTARKRPVMSEEELNRIAMKSPRKLSSAEIEELNEVIITPV